MTESLQIFVSDDPRPEPKVRSVGAQGRAVAVGEIVASAHQGTIETALGQFNDLKLNRSDLDAVLTYCAERRCEAHDATCSGCVRRTDADGITSLDDYISTHGQIRTGDERVQIHGQGTTDLTVESLEKLSKSWRGEELWFWARRVLRKLRHGVRRADVPGQPVADEGETPAIVLVGPQLADNIGMSARAMGNFGLDKLYLVNPRDGWPNERARVAASGANYIIDEAKKFDDVPEALEEFHWVCATTARQRDLRKPVITPEQAAKEMATRIGAGQRCAIMFGRESSGLESSELACADALVMIPVNTRFASLNLAQAVLLLGYAWILAKPNAAHALGRVTTYEDPIEPGVSLKKHRLATKGEMEGFFKQLENALDTQGFFRPPERRAVLVRNLRAMFTRMAATDQEVRTLRGIVATLLRSRRVT